MLPSNALLINVRLSFAVAYIESLIEVHCRNLQGLAIGSFNSQKHAENTKQPQQKTDRTPSSINFISTIHSPSCSKGLRQ
jgi:hypothetical protein